MKSRNSHGITVNTYFTLVKYFLLGVVAAELFLFIFELVKFTNIKGNLPREFSWLLGLIILGLILIWKKKKRILLFFTSIRLDIVLMLLTGFFLVYTFDNFSKGFFVKWIQWISFTLSLKQIIVLCLSPFIFLVSVILRKLQIQFKTRKNEDEKSRFMDDSEVKDLEGDFFGFNTQAEKFAKSVYNLGSSKSLVFGIDAPWGTGKSTFVNLCKKYWVKELKNKTIVYDFNPLRYENRDNLFEKFVNGLISEIRNHVYSPELEGLVSKYARLLKDTKANISFFGVRFNVPFKNNSIDETFEELKSVLEIIDKKIIIIVDDLDRISFSNIKEILYVIKKAFNIPNVSYVLCYDTDSLNKLDQHKLDSEKISEFLEKFINVKTSIYLDYNLLLDYFIENKNQAIENDLTIDTVLINRALAGLKGIFKSPDFHLYLPFIGDARKIKRLVNTIILLHIEQTDFENADFNSEDLIHLLLIYINYPSIFRKIYNTETNENKGFFSAKYNFGGDRNKVLFSNSPNYQAYIKKENGLTDSQIFLLNKIFDVDNRLANKLVTTEMTSTLACFNGSGLGDRNLESYIKLITRSYSPPKTENYMFYIKQKDEIIKTQKIEAVFQSNDFSVKAGEEMRRQLWNVLANTSPSEYSVEKAREVINYLTETLPNYSMLEHNGTGGFRRRLPFMLVIMLDRFGWVDKGGNRTQNIEDNISQIAEWIFGEGIHIQNGILEKIGEEDRGILGLYDMLSFRLSCCEDRGGDIFNLSRSLISYGKNGKKETDRVVKEIRVISQKIFKMFKNQYIDKKKNIFSEVAQITFDQLTGEYSEYYREILIDIEIKLDVTKNSIINFILYQLCNTKINHGIGCGYYDSNGSDDNNGINKQMNKYLFGTCFNPDIDINGYIYFLDYLLANLQQYRDEEDAVEYIANLEGFTHSLAVENLSAYWKRHGELIKQQDFGERTVMTINYAATYREDLGDVFRTLDTLINEELQTS